METQGYTALLDVPWVHLDLPNRWSDIHCSQQSLLLTRLRSPQSQEEPAEEYTHTPLAMGLVAVEPILARWDQMVYPKQTHM